MITVEVRGHDFVLRPERALWWPERSLLVIADMHLGKSETFQMHGLPLPAGAQEEDLERVLQLTEDLDIGHVLFLGDLIHTRRGITPEIVARFSAWIESFGRRVTVVIGNHDLHFVKAWPREWARAELSDRFVDGSFVFQHEPPPPENLGHGPFYWVGHLHPMIRLSAGPDRLRLPCFEISEHQGLLPAFSSLAGGSNVRPRKHDRVFAIGEGKVIEVP